MVRTRSASRNALLELNDDLLRTVLLFCEVDTLRARTARTPGALKLPVRRCMSGELPGNTDALRTALWAAGQFTTRLIGMPTTASMTQKFWTTVLWCLLAPTRFSATPPTARMVFAITRIEVNRIALHGNLIAVGLMRNENSAVRLYERLANEEGPDLLSRTDRS